MISRCVACRRYIWPWQRRGWLIRGGKQEPLRWHASCWERER